MQKKLHTNFPKKGGAWTGMPGNSVWCMDDSFLFKCYGVTKSIKDWREMYHIYEPIKVLYSEGEPNFDCYSLGTICVEYKKEYNYRKIKDLHNAVNVELQKCEWNKSLWDEGAYNPMRACVENMANDCVVVKGCRNTYHEKRDGKTVLIIPDFIHKLCKHNGGRAIANIVQCKEDF